MSHDVHHPPLRGGAQPEAPPIAPRARWRRDDEAPRVWDRRENVDRLLRVLYALAGLLVLLDLIVHRHNEHPWEHVIAFYPLYGFVGIVVLVLLAKVLRRIVMRPEDHYHDR